VDLLRHVLTVVQLLGILAVLVGLLVQVRRPERAISPVIRDGAGVSFVAGLLRAAVADPGRVEVVVETIIGLVVLVLVLANRRRARIAPGLWALLVVLVVADACVAVFAGGART
jgi:hypothetical protein